MLRRSASSRAPRLHSRRNPRRLSGLRRGSQRLAGESQDWEAVLPPPAPRYRRRYIKNTSGEQTMRIPLGNS